MLTLSDRDVITPDVDLEIIDSSLPSPGIISPSNSLCELRPNESLKHLDIRHLIPSPRSEDRSFPPSQLPRAFSSEGNSADSMDWPPIGSMLYPGRGNVRQGCEGDIGFQVSNILPAPL